MNGRANTNSLKRTATLSVGVLLLASVVGCASCPPAPVVPASVYRPPEGLMEAGEAQYLLPENQQRKTNQK